MSANEPDAESSIQADQPNSFQVPRYRSILSRGGDDSLGAGNALGKTSSASMSTIKAPSHRPSVAMTLLPMRPSLRIRVPGISRS